MNVLMGNKVSKVITLMTLTNNNLCKSTRLDVNNLCENTILKVVKFVFLALEYRQIGSLARSHGHR